MTLTEARLTMVIWYWSMLEVTISTTQQISLELSLLTASLTAEQKDVYQIVLAALDAAIDTVKPGASWNSMYPAAMKVLAQGLIDLKILSRAL